MTSVSNCKHSLIQANVNFSIDTIDWEKMSGLIPAIIQHQHTAEVLMLGYMNREALEQTLHTKRVTFFSRSKQRLWQKGETSGHFLELQDIFLDCDRDTLLILAEPQGPTCHLGFTTCFNTPPQTNWQFLDTLQTVIQQRQQQPQENSYTSKLFHAGIRRIAQKVGEEGVEVALAAVAQQPAELIEEAADLLFHLLVLLTAKSLELSHVIDVLRQRHAK